MQSQKVGGYPLNFEDQLFIQRVSAYAIDHLYQINPKRSRHYNTEKRAHLKRRFTSDLRSMLTAPDQATTKMTSKVLKHMNNIDRLMLLKMRPTLIPDYWALEEILDTGIPPRDRLLVTCSQVHLLFDPEDEICLCNVNMITGMMPPEQRGKFHCFAIKMTEKMRNEYLASLPTPPYIYSFGAATLFAAANLAMQLFTDEPIYKFATLLAVAVNTGRGIYQLHQDQQIDNLTEQFFPFLWSAQRAAENHTPSAEHGSSPRL